MSDTTVIVRYTAVATQIEVAKHAISALVAKVLDHEADCAGIKVIQDSDNPACFMLIERWPSREVFLGPHMQQPHIQSFIQQAGAFLAGPPDISFWQAINTD